MPALERLHEDETLTVYAAGNLGIGVWADAPKKGQIQTLHHAFFDHVGRLRKAAYANVILGGTPKFGDFAREEALAMVKDRRLAVLATAHVILIGGFAGAATRAFLSGVTLITSSRGSMARTFGDVPPAAAWLETAIPRVEGVVWKPGDVRRAMEEASGRRS